MEHSSVLPPLYCPFESRIHVAADRAENWMLGFCRRHRVGDGKLSDDDLRAMRIAEFVSRAYPDSSLERLCVALDWTAWAFIADDRADVTEPSKLRTRYDRYLKTLRGTATVDERVAPLDELRHRIRASGGEETLHRFTSAVATWFDAMLWEVKNRYEGVIPSVRDYITMREFDVGMYTEFALFDVTHATDTTGAIWEIAEIRTLMQSTSNIIGWSNDIYSYLKESSMQDPHNLVGLIARERRWSIERALAEVAVMCNREVDRFVYLADHLQRRIQRNRTAIKFVDMLRAWIRSNLDWSLRSARYETVGAVVVDQRPKTGQYWAVPDTRIREALEGP